MPIFWHMLDVPTIEKELVKCAQVNRDSTLFGGHGLTLQAHHVRSRHIASCPTIGPGSQLVHSSQHAVTHQVRRHHMALHTVADIVLHKTPVPAPHKT